MELIKRIGRRQVRVECLGDTRSWRWLQVSAGRGGCSWASQVTLDAASPSPAWPPASHYGNLRASWDEFYLRGFSFCLLDVALLLASYFSLCLIFYFFSIFFLCVYRLTFRGMSFFSSRLIFFVVFLFLNLLFLFGFYLSRIFMFSSPHLIFLFRFSLSYLLFFSLLSISRYWDVVLIAVVFIFVCLTLSCL